MLRYTLLISLLSISLFGSSIPNDYDQPCVDISADSLKIDCLLDLTKSTLNSSPLDGIEHVDAALKIALSSNDIQRIYKCYLIKGWCYGYAGQPEQSKECYLDGVKFLEPHDAHKNIGNLFMNLGVDYMLFTINDSSLIYTLKAIPYYEKVGDSKELGKVYNNLGMLYRRINYFSKSIESYKESVRLKKELRDSTGLATAYLNLSAVFFYSSQPDSSLTYANKCIHLSRMTGDIESVGTAMMNRGLAYKEKGDFTSSMNDFREAEKILSHQVKGKGLLNIYENLAFFHSVKENLDSTQHYLKLARSIPEQHWKIQNYRLEALSLAKLNESLNDYKQASEYWQLYSSYADSIYAKDQMIQMTELSAKFEDQKQKATIAEQSAELSKNQASQSRLTSIIVAIISISLIMILLFMYFLLKNRKAKELANSEIKTRIAEINSLQTQLASRSEIPLPKVAMTMTKEEVNTMLVNPLSERELDVLLSLAQGKSYKVMAEEMFISVNTIKTHISRIYGKLDVKNRTEATLKASSLNLLDQKSEK